MLTETNHILFCLTAWEETREVNEKEKQSMGNFFRDVIIAGAIVLCIILGGILSEAIYSIEDDINIQSDYEAIEAIYCGYSVVDRVEGTAYEIDRIEGLEEGTIVLVIVDKDMNVSAVVTNYD